VRRSIWRTRRVELGYASAEERRTRRGRSDRHVAPGSTAGGVDRSTGDERVAGVVRYRAKLVALRSGLKAQVHKVMAKEGVLPTVTDMFCKAGEAQLDGFSSVNAFTSAVVTARSSRQTVSAPSGAVPNRLALRMRAGEIPDELADWRSDFARSLRLARNRLRTIPFLIRNRLRAIRWDDRRNYPALLDVHGYNRPVVEFLRNTDCRMIAEIGVYQGHTSREIANWLAGEGELHLYDFHDTVQKVADELAAAGHHNVRAYGNSYRYLDSYNWTLGQVLRDHPEPIYDFVYVDGAHTWAIDGFTTLLVDRLLLPGGYIAYDNYLWTLSASPSTRPEVFPLTAKMYTDEQMHTQQVKMIFDLLIRRDDRFQEVVENTIWRKTRA
jgi:predicted O-methyltransferase YrrM